jgi:hypothetical protein
MSEYLPIQKCAEFGWEGTVLLTFGAELIQYSMADTQLQWTQV